MAVLTKYESFEALKSGETVPNENLLHSAVDKEFENFISLLRSAKKAISQCDSHIRTNGQPAKK